MYVPSDDQQIIITTIEITVVNVLMRAPRVEVEIGDLTFLILFLQLFSSLRFISMIILEYKCAVLRPRR